MKRITPLTLVAAAVLTYVVLGLWDGTIKFQFQGLLLFLMVVVVGIGDQLFRFVLKKLWRIWLIETFFLIFVLLCLWLLELW